MSGLTPSVLDEHFPRYEEYDPAVPTWCVTPGDTGFIHRFFETSPISPSGRYLAVTKLPFEDQLPAPGDTAEVVLVDLHTGKRECLEETAGWDTQMGANIQWGGNDETLLFNDMDTETWQPSGVKMDPSTGTTTRLDGTIYDVSADGSYAVSPNLLTTRITQDGYGVIAPDDVLPRSDQPANDDGVFLTDTATGDCELIVSVADILEQVSIEDGDYGPGTYYVFHTMISPRGDRIMINFRYWPEEGGYWRWIPHLVTMDTDGTNCRLCLPTGAWERGGHHICWRPDGERITMNLRLEEDGPMRLVSIDPAGGGYDVLSETLRGGGHPAPHPDNRTFVTDAYQHEPMAYGDGTIPLRLLDVVEETETELLRINTATEMTGENKQLRLDPHPAWGPANRFVTFNAAPTGKRQVFIADLEAYVEETEP